MRQLFNDDWQFCEIAIDNDSMFKDGKPVLFLPDDFYEQTKSLNYVPVNVPHDWMIGHVKDLYKNSTGFYKKTFVLSEEQVNGCRNAVRFEGIYMNCGVWVNGKKAGEWKYGYTAFEFDISEFVHAGENEIVVIAVYQNCNTRWYSGAGIFRDVHFINTKNTFLVSDGVYIHASPCVKDDYAEWSVSLSCEVASNTEKLDGYSVRTKLLDMDGNQVELKTACSSKVDGACGKPVPLCDEKSDFLHSCVCGIGGRKLFRSSLEFCVTNPNLWNVENPYYYIAVVELLDSDGNIIDSEKLHCGFKDARFTNNKGFFLNGKHVKIQGACQHHDLGLFGSAFDVNVLRRQFLRLKEMGVNSVRCSHNPPPAAWMDLCDEIGLLVDDEAFDMWEKSKTPFDYGNYFNEWCSKDVASWVRKDRNHPSLLMWSIGNEIYDTHMGNGLEITKRLYGFVKKHDGSENAPVTIASNYMMTDGAQNCAKNIDTVGYNYLERLYNEHHEKYPEWKIYGSETGSTVQSRGIYHFPDSLKLVTFSDGQCSTLGNCTTTWGAANTQTVIANDRDCPFSAGQYIWTGWDYIGEPTPYHTKNSFFGQIDTAGFPKDTFYLYKSEWAYKNAAPFVHVLPYWDWNEGQIIDVKAYSNADAVELFCNGVSYGKQTINHKDGKEPFGKWQLAYQKGEIKVVGYDEKGNVIAEETKKSCGDPSKILLCPEKEKTGNLYFIDILTCDDKNVPVENARNYITIKVSGDAELVGMDNGDSTDYEEYVSCDGKTHTRRLFANRLVAAIRASSENASFTVKAFSKGLEKSCVSYDGVSEKWTENAADCAGTEKMNDTVVVKTSDDKDIPVNDYVPVRKIELSCEGSCTLTPENREIKVTAKILPANATDKKILWNPVLKECVPSDYIEIASIKDVAPGVQTAVIRGACDGECILRCTSHNGTKYDEVISDLNFSVEGIGNPKLNPYKLVEACRMSRWNENKGKPTVTFESGISNRFLGETWVAFDKVDFGSDGADTIHIPIFTFDTELPLEVWDGIPDDAEKAVCLGKFTYRHESIYNTYSENVFTLDRRLFGVHTLTLKLFTGMDLHGFYFDKTPKAFAKLRALDANDIVGDTFEKTCDAVEKIGNNVNLDFADMDFGSKKAGKLVICGKSDIENNTINLKFFAKDGSSTTQVIEFSHTDGYEEKTFEIKPVTGSMQKVSFVFLPGCRFDFKWFRFEE